MAWWLWRGIRLFLIIFSLIGIVYYIMVMIDADKAEGFERRFSSKMGSGSKKVTVLEDNTTHLPQWFKKSKAFSIIAILFFVVLLIFLFTILKP